MVQTLPKSCRPPAERKVGRHSIRKNIERMILDGDFLPGEKLVQSQLAKKYKVSQGMVREALFELKECGLVETSDNRGMFVRSLDSRGIYEMFVVREIFDGVAARECCGRMTPAIKNRFLNMVNKIFDLATAGREKEKAELDRKFHLEIAKLTDNRHLLMLAQQHHVLGKMFAVISDPEETRQGHFAIINAISAGDRNEAEKAAREHVRVALRPLEGAMIHRPCAVLWLTEKKRSKER